MKKCNTHRRTTTLNLVSQALIGMIVLCISTVNANSSSSGAVALFSVENSQTNTKSVQSAIKPRIQINNKNINALKVSQDVTVTLPMIGTIGGKVVRNLIGNANTAQNILKSQSLSDSSLFTQSDSSRVISLDNRRGSLKIESINNKTTRITWIDMLRHQVYVAKIDDNGEGEFLAQDANKFYCVDYALTEQKLTVEKTLAINGATPSLSQLQSLQSRPGAPQVILVDYWGGRLQNTAWNDNFNSGNAIDYTPYDTNGNLSEFTTSEREVMWIGWLEMVEDYAPFNVNITTSVSVYNNTAASNRARVIATRTNYFFSNAGGVAYVNAYYGSPPDYWRVAWVWNLNSLAMGQTHSHEAGHMLGLLHDGTSTSNYYRGHGDWGPIMGAPFGKEYVQWSQGNYPGANNQENDMQIISSLLPVVNDDAGDSTSQARLLVNDVTDYEGIITPNALFPDIDVYAIDMIESGTLSLTVQPLLGDEFKSIGSNGTYNFTLLNSANSIIARQLSTQVSPLSAINNKLSVNRQLTAGRYYLIIDAQSPNSNLSTGFNEYANGGLYRINFTRIYGPIDPPTVPVDDGDILDFMPAILGAIKNRQETQ